jgi:hypothetical protein
LFERLDAMELTKLSLDLAEVYHINDIVIEGLCLLLTNCQSLTQLYLDFYELEQLTEDSYLLLA